jgi:hypothetical protein
MEERIHQQNCNRKYENWTSRGHTAPAHPPCNSQAEVFNKTLVKYMKKVINDSTLKWEWYLTPLMFCYNISYHRTINTSQSN